jgi:hypothetical protein
LAVIFLAFLASGCTTTGPGELEVTVVNGLVVPVVILPWELEASHLVDPVPELVLEDGHGNLLEPGEATRFKASDIGGEFGPGMGLRIFVYEVVGPGAPFHYTHTETAEELEAHDFRVVLGTS